MRFDQPVSYTQVVLDRDYRAELQRRIPGFDPCLFDKIQVQGRICEMTRDAVIAFYLHLQGRKVRELESKRETEYVPTTWWQHLKQVLHTKRWFPRWMVRRWPVQNRAIVTKVVEEHANFCPHVNVPNNQIHFGFLAEDLCN